MSAKQDTLYDDCCSQLKALLESGPDLIARLANAAALLNVCLENINWVGFYFYHADTEKLTLGPFQGLPACTEIAYGKGVCGTCVKTQTVQRIADVHQFPGHIACDASSNSEIVLPVFKDGKIAAVLDIDSPLTARFSQEDEAGLRRVVKLLEQYYY